MKVSVLIPTKNEPLINKLIEKVHKALINYNHEVVVVDKSDKVPKLIGGRVVRQKSNGLGNSIIEGLNHVSGDIIITMDGDLSHNPKDLPRFLQKIDEGYDIIVGSRYIKGGGTVNWNLYRRITSKGANILTQFLLNINVHDITSNYRCYKKNVLDSIDLVNIKSSGYAFVQEILYLSKLKGFKIQEIPIIFVDREYGKSKLTKKEIIKFLINLIKLKISSIFET